MRQMSLQKANNKRKALLTKLNSYNKPIEAFYVGQVTYLGDKPVQELREELKANWDSLADIYSEYRKFNKAVMNALGTTKVSVPKEFNLHSLTISKEKEETNIAEAINRKQFYKNLLCSNGLYNELTCNHTEIVRKINLTIVNEKEKLSSKIDSQFGPSSTASPKARKEYEDSIKCNYEVNVLDPNKMGDKIKLFKEAIDDYLVEVDSAISNVFENTIIDIDD